MVSPPGVADVRNALEGEGVPAALRILNARTPHRFTGVFRYDGDMLRNVFLVDRYDPVSTRGEDVPLADSYCGMVGLQRSPLEILDIHTDGRFAPKPGPVVSYCGVMIRSGDGQPYGTLCHFDVKPCEERSSDIPLLQEAARLVYEVIRRSPVAAPNP
jgi:GAF domain